MRRVLLLVIAGLMSLGASRGAHVAYRVTVPPPPAGRPAILDVELRLRGDADGETRLVLPARLASDLAVRGAKAEAPDATHRILRHRPGAKLTLRYRVEAAATSQGLSALGEAIFATPEGRGREASTFRWRKLPSGWRAATDADHGAMGGAMTVDDLRQSVILAGPNLQLIERPIPRGTLRVATFAADRAAGERLADVAAQVLTGQRTFWDDETGPFFIALGPFRSADGAIDRGDGLAYWAQPTGETGPRDAVALGHMRAWIPGRVGRVSAPAPWLTDGLAEFISDRLLLRTGLLSAEAAAARLDAADRGKRRGVLLALKWDEAVRTKTGGKADLDDVILRMRDHYRRFPPGQGPDVITGLVSAAWLTARLDIRPDIARYVDRGAHIDLPEEMFDGCLQARITVTPAFDAGFNTEASFAARRVQGVVRRGPAWNSGVRDGMALETWTYKADDMTRMIELTVRPSGRRATPRKIAYWPYGDATVETRKLQLTPGMTDAQRAACGRKMGGL